MIKLIRMWYKSKVLKYTTHTTTYEELSDKFIAQMESLTLAELAQYHWMSKEMISLSALATAAMPKEPTVLPEPKPGGQYL